MKLIPVPNSSNVTAFGWDEATQTLRVEFRGGKQYDYANVPRELYAEFAVAPSKGKFIAGRIKPAFECTPVEAE